MYGVIFALALIGVWIAARRNRAPVASTASTDTEFTAEVVRITQVLEHPNAERLEIARFELSASGETSHEVVIQKGSAKPGDLMAYFSVDCVLPTAHPEFAFLAQRPDGVGKTHIRLRAARLRGVYSQGLLVPAPDTHAFGDRVDESFGVTYHRAPEPEGDGPARVTRKPSRQPMPVYSVDSLKKLPRLFDEGEEVVVTEKIHGTNFRFGWVRRKLLGIPLGWKFVVGSHRVIKDGTGTNWYGEDLWRQAAEAMRLAERTRNRKGIAFYGELYGYTPTGKAIQDLTYGRTPARGPGLAVFDIKRISGDQWLPFNEREMTCRELGLPTVPVLRVAPYSLELLELAEGKTTMDPAKCAHVREGVVIESLKTRKKAKYVGAGYLMRKEAA
jgi:RNA ligase (TIGR02306 family)